jgi:hypothetical protein
MKTYRTAAAAFLMLALLMTGTVTAQNPVPAEKKFSKLEVTNLLNGIKSKNTGLMKSSIYMAGKYRVTEAVKSLTALLKEEKDPAVRLLIARVLYQIGDYDGMNAVYELSKNDKDSKVRNISRALYLDFAPGMENVYTIAR